MNPAFIVRFRPTGPWRIGTDSGARDRVDLVFHSDRLFSAVTNTMAQLGWLEEWLADTAGSAQGPKVRLSSCFPFIEDLLFVAPPRNLWPPPPSPKVRWRNARFVPLTVVQAVVGEQPLDDGAWQVDGASECLMPRERAFHSGPFRSALRSHAAVDRLQSGTVEVHRSACLEFAGGGGMWALVAFEDQDAEARWSAPLRGALRLLADAGMGGERSLGWGRSEAPEFVDGALPGMLLPPAPERPPAEVTEEGEVPPPRPPAEKGWWLLSTFSPAPEDAVDWQRGSYSLLTRGGRVESSAGSGGLKKTVRMVEEGSVLASDAPLRGAAPDVAPDGFPHPVYRCGFALALPVPLRPAERPLGAS